MGNQRSKWSQGIWVGSITIGSIWITNNDLGISRSLLTSIGKSRDSCRMNIGSTLQRGPRGDTLGSIVLGSGQGNIGVKWGNSSIGIGHQMLGISRPLTIKERCRNNKILSMCKVGIHNSSSLTESCEMFLGGGCIVGIIGICHQLPTDCG